MQLLPPAAADVVQRFIGARVHPPFRRRKLGVGQGPVAVALPEVLNRPLDRGVRDSGLAELMHDHRLGDVLEAVDPRRPRRLRRSDVAVPCPLADLWPRDAGQVAYLVGEVMTSWRE